MIAELTREQKLLISDNANKRVSRILQDEHSELSDIIYDHLAADQDEWTPQEWDARLEDLWESSGKTLEDWMVLWS